MEYHKCRCCDCKYEEHPADKSSNNLERIAHHMGVCSHHCMDKMTKKGFNKEALHTFIFGDGRKRNGIKMNKNYYK